MSSLSDRLRELRNKKGDTQKQMADLLGLKNERTYRQYEAGEIDLSTSKLLFLADYFDVSTDYLLGRSNAPKSLTQEELEYHFVSLSKNIYDIVDKGTVVLEKIHSIHQPPGKE